MKINCLIIARLGSFSFCFQRGSAEYRSCIMDPCENESVLNGAAAYIIDYALNVK